MSDLHPEVEALFKTSPTCSHGNYCEADVRRIAALAVEKEREEMELVGWLQKIGSKLAFFEGDIDPRTVHDNGKPCYPVYRRRGKP